MVLFRVLRLSALVIIAFQLTACRFVQNRQLLNTHKSYLKYLKQNGFKESHSAHSTTIKNGKAFARLVRNAPKLKLRRTIKRHKGTAYKYSSKQTEKEFAKLDNWLVSVKAKLDESVVKIKSLGKENFEMENDFRPDFEAKIIQNEMNIFYELNYLKSSITGITKKLTIYLSKFDNANLEEFPEINEKRRAILSDFLAILSLVKILKSDIVRTANKIKINSESVSSYDGIELENLKLFKSKVVKKDKTQFEKIMSGIKEYASESESAEILAAIKEFNDQLATKSILYDPSQPDEPIVHFLVILSNLTWGLVNTLVGLGFVLTRLLLSPWWGLPEIRIAESRMQIYADVCGLGVPGSKMSAGLFELDYCTNYSFASHHEAGHAKQSAVLGPLYFPAAILSYILVMGHGGYIEWWADEWATEDHDH